MADTTESGDSKKLYVSAASARHFVESVLAGHGAPAAHAAVVARCLVAADLRGVDTHGINRLPSYAARIRQGVLDARAAPELTRVTHVVASVDARNGFGFLAAETAMAEAVNMAENFGIGLVGVKHSNHFGMAAWVCQSAVDRGMMSL